MARQVVGMFDSVRDAQAAVRELQSMGVNKADISFVASNARGEYDETGTYVGGNAGGNESKAAEGAGTGAAGGAVLGGLAGVLVGLGALAIPGIGPVLAAGPFAAAIGTTGAAVGGGIAGAAAGGIAGGLVGALVGAGIPEEDAQVYSEGVRRGGTLVMARVDDNQVDQVIDVMDRYNVVDIDERREQLRSSGWTGYDEQAGPYDVAETDAGMRGTARGGVTTTQGTTRSRRARLYAPGTTAGSGMSRAGSASGQELNADLGHNGDVGRRDPRNTY